MKSLRITFVLPVTNNLPIGGFKIVYQYANELVQRGHTVTICFTYSARPEVYRLLNYAGKIKHRLFPRFKNHYRVTWFKIDPRIRLIFDVINKNELPNADAVIATSAPTATFVAHLKKEKGRKYYLIQSSETWWYDDEDELNNTYRLGLINMAISQELVEKVYRVSGVKPVYLPDFYNNREFFVSNNVENRSNTVALLNHTQASKRTKFGMDVLKDVKKLVPDLKVELFGAYPIETKLPNYFSYTYQATPAQLRDEVFGKAKVYLLPSVLEGWGLTGIEAMASGAALVASRIGGIEDYANDENSLLVAPDDHEGFVSAVTELLKNNSKRISLSTKALSLLPLYSIEASVDKLEKVLETMF
ncbi:glycosyltransferase family 4 protein [Lacticaseibacillus paracasei]|uniref:glycosyltransferase family 4 protein n=1 Tax=Lacticaseibacillus paracasei TaxID=1597 RepID=UPI0030D87597